jgi:hydrogenase expression/formation protein HypD
LEQRRAVVENQYSRSVRLEGNVTARRLMNQVFQVVPRKWRGIGEIPRSGLGLRPQYASLDAEERFGVAQLRLEESSECQSGLVLRGKIKPAGCPAFGTRCTPEHPLGATMVSSEGACAAYYRYRRQPGA